MNCFRAIAPLLFHHGTPDYDAGIGVSTNILKLVSASADHEVAAMALRNQSHAASNVRIHGIGPGDETKSRHVNETWRLV